MQKKYILQFLVLSFGFFFILFLLKGVSYVDKNYCIDIPHYPHFIEIPNWLSNNIFNYSLYYAIDTRYPTTLSFNDGRFHIPILFVHGHSGTYGQIGTIVTENKNLEIESFTSFGDSTRSEKIALDFFTIDFHSYSSAFHGNLLWSQAHFFNECIKKIISIFEGHSNTAKEVIVMGHSFGGIVARSAFLLDNFPFDTIHSIFTLSTPHQTSPIFTDSSVKSLYNQINSFWSKYYSSSLHSTSLVFEEEFYHCEGSIEYYCRKPNFSVLEKLFSKVVLASVVGGNRDLTVRSELGDLNGIFPSSQSIFSYSSSIPNVEIPLDHICIMWCKQFMDQLLSLLDKYGRVLSHNGYFHIEDRMHLFHMHFTSPLPFQWMNSQFLFNSSFIPFHKKCSLNYPIENVHSTFSIYSNDILKSFPSNDVYKLTPYNSDSMFILLSSIPYSHICLIVCDVKRQYCHDISSYISKIPPETIPLFDSSFHSAGYFPVSLARFPISLLLQKLFQNPTLKGNLSDFSFFLSILQTQKTDNFFLMARFISIDRFFININTSFLESFTSTIYDSPIIEFSLPAYSYDFELVSENKNALFQPIIHQVSSLLPYQHDWFFSFTNRIFRVSPFSFNDNSVSTNQKITVFTSPEQLYHLKIEKNLYNQFSAYLRYVSITEVGSSCFPFFWIGLLLQIYYFKRDKTLTQSISSILYNKNCILFDIEMCVLFGITRYIGSFIFSNVTFPLWFYIFMHALGLWLVIIFDIISGAFLFFFRFITVFSQVHFSDFFSFLNQKYGRISKFFTIQSLTSSSFDVIWHYFRWFLYLSFLVFFLLIILTHPDLTIMTSLFFYCLFGVVSSSLKFGWNYHLFDYYHQSIFCIILILYCSIRFPVLLLVQNIPLSIDFISVRNSLVIVPILVILWISRQKVIFRHSVACWWVFYFIILINILWCNAALYRIPYLLSLNCSFLLIDYYIGCKYSSGI